MSRARRGVVKDQINIQLEQIGAVPEDFFFDHIAMFGQKIHGPIKLIETEILGLRQPGLIEPALMAGELGAWPVQPLRRHGKKRGFMRRFQLLLTHTLLDGFANPELLPHRLGDMNDPEVEHAINHDIRDLNGPAPFGGPIDTAVDQNTANAVRQPFQDIAIQAVGTAEAMDDLGFGPLLGLVPHVLGECVILDRRSVSILPFGAPKVHT